MGEHLTIRLIDKELEVEVVALLPGTLAGPYVLLSPDLVPTGIGPWTHIVQLTEGADRSTVEAELGTVGELASLEECVSAATSEEERQTLDIMIVLLAVIAMINAVVIAASARV